LEKFKVRPAQPALHPPRASAQGLRHCAIAFQPLASLTPAQDAIDANSTAELNLPMLCVVGDQTSGKSSLLQALTGVAFPVKSGTCTRMPITVRCRKGEEEGVWLISRDVSERKLDPASVGKEIMRAQAEAVKQDGKGFSKISLRLEARGPEQMELILVDLPGLIHNGQDVEIVTQMVT
jgi:energy-coupling factor transporter ATP-binding protein EcfA2